ncbi:type II toxin-antitoxin system RelE/ParE family toxin [Lactovum odontotermitis]
MITHGFTKKTQTTPKSEINRAKALREKYKRGDLL